MPDENSNVGWKRWWKWISRIGMTFLWAYLLIQLAPHLGAFVGVENGERAEPSFVFTTLNGDTLSSSNLQGKVVLVNFWATWCPPCRVEMPLLQRMAERHRDAGLIVLGLSRDVGPVSGVKTFLTEREITYPVAVVSRDAEMVFGGVRGYPTSFLLDRDGRIRHKALGPLAMLSFEPAVRRLLAETGPVGRPGQSPEALDSSAMRMAPAVAPDPVRRRR